MSSPTIPFGSSAGGRSIREQRTGTRDRGPAPQTKALHCNPLTKVALKAKGFLPRWKPSRRDLPDSRATGMKDRKWNQQFLDTSSKTCSASCVTRGSRFLDFSLSFYWGRLARVSKCCAAGICPPSRPGCSITGRRGPPILGGFLFIASQTRACNFDKSRARHDRHEQYISSPNYARGRPSLPSGKWYPLPSTCERAPSRSCGIATGRRPRLVAQGRAFRRPLDARFRRRPS